VWRAIHEDASLFSETMIGIHGAEPAAVVAAYDFLGLRLIVDVGGEIPYARSRHCILSFPVRTTLA
jgi:hypothetical protein